MRDDMTSCAVRRGHLGTVGTALALLFLTGASVASAQESPQPIQVLIDVHADPMTQCPPHCAFDLEAQTALYLHWVDLLNWILDEAGPFGAKISFLSTGEFMEWVLEPPETLVPPLPSNPGSALIGDLYASGGQIGTHSHRKHRIGPHEWRDLPPDPTDFEIDEQWADHIDLVDDVITEALGITDSDDVRAVNTSRGGGIPDSPAERLRRMAEYGFSIHEQGPDEEFYAYFAHYAMNPWRPAGSSILSEDPEGPVVLAPTGSVLGTDQEHFGIRQDNRLARVQSRFLMELLNWLHDVHVAETRRVWTFGWGSHPTDYDSGKPTRAAYPQMLRWLSDHFVGHTVGGHEAATYSTFVRARDLFSAWEATHPGASSFDYPADHADWSLYPYLIPARVYLAEGEYVGPRPDVGTVRWHALDAPASAGGPFRFFLAYTEDDFEATVDLSPYLAASWIAVVNPITGDSATYPASAVPVGPTGSLLVPPARVIPLCSGASDPDFPTLGSPCSVGIGECSRDGIFVCRSDMRGVECSATPGSPVSEMCDGLDNDCDGMVDEDPPADALDVRLTADELIWNPIATTETYDVAWGNLDVLQATGGDFSASSRPCLANDHPTTRIGLPPPSGVWYLVRPVNCAGAGSYGSPERDGGIGAAAGACP